MLAAAESVLLFRSCCSFAVALCAAASRKLLSHAVLEVAWLLLLEPQKPSMLLETPSRPETVLGCRSDLARFFQLMLEGFGGCPLPLVLGNHSSLSRFRQKRDGSSHPKHVSSNPSRNNSAGEAGNESW